MLICLYWWKRIQFLLLFVLWWLYYHALTLQLLYHKCSIENKVQYVMHDFVKTKLFASFDFLISLSVMPWIDYTRGYFWSLEFRTKVNKLQSFLPLRHSCLKFTKTFDLSLNFYCKHLQEFYYSQGWQFHKNKKVSMHFHFTHKIKYRNMFLKNKMLLK